MRKLLEGQLPTIYDLINREVLVKAKDWLRDNGYEDIVIIVDELDRINRPEVQKQVFLEKVSVLRGLDCHIVYTIPIDFAYSLDNERLIQSFEEMLTVPVIPVTRRDGEKLPEGLRALERIVEKRATDANVTLDRFFENPLLLEHICRLSGGHVRNLLFCCGGPSRYLRRCRLGRMRYGWPSAIEPWISFGPSKRNHSTGPSSMS